MLSLNNLKGLRFEHKEDLINYIEGELGYDVLCSVGKYEDGYFNWNLINAFESDAVEIFIYIQHNKGLIDRINVEF